MIYTSGSTGRPKGVSVTHGGLANFAEQTRLRSDAKPFAHVLGFASPSFDASVLEYLLATVTRGVLAYRPSDAVGGAALQSFMRDHAITHTFLTPTVLATLNPAELPDLAGLMAGGEAVPQALVDEWSEYVNVHDLYGPTETTIGITISSPMAAGVPVRLGGPIAGVGLQVLDAALNPVPVGVRGELYVSGRGLSRGYLDRPGLTADRFVADPFGGPGARMYRTGDIVRWYVDADGGLTLGYGGRSDDQIKMRGLRIELGEIETELGAHDRVDSAVVVGLADDGGIADAGTSVVSALVAYVVTNGAVEVDQLRDHLAQHVPEYMVPAYFVVLDALPLTPVGKLDRAALPLPVVSAAGEVVAAATAAEAQLAVIVGGLLGIEQVSVTESFFALGGDSIMSIQLASAAKTVGLAISPREIFEHKTIRALARVAEDADVELPMVAEPSGVGPAR